MAIQHTTGSHFPSSLTRFIPTRVHPALVALFCLVGLTAVVPTLAGALGQWGLFPDCSRVMDYRPEQAVQVFDRFDRLAAVVPGSQDRVAVSLNQVCPSMQNAILAAEDHNFYQHSGVNFLSIVRAAFANMQAGRVVEGGSTITQQLTKNIYFKNQPRSMWVKTQEALIASELELFCSKRKILEVYLNEVYFGNGVYGIERAAQRYFGKHAGQLTIAEAAFLAGIVKAPSEMAQDSHLAVARQHEVLEKMTEYGFITPQQAVQAKGQQLVFKNSMAAYRQYPYYVGYVMEQLRQRYLGRDMWREGLHVYTNLDPAAQKIAEATMSAGIKKAPVGVTQGALVSMSVHDGAVLAMVGGVGDYWKNQFNRATSVHTAGSAFKPFVYLTGLINGVLQPDTVLDDSPIVLRQQGKPDYIPRDFDGQFLGPISVRKALYLSRNICAIEVGQMVGIENVVATARAAGITSRLDPYPSLAIGSSAVSPLEMAGAYGTLARSGEYIQPQVLRRIDNYRGQTISFIDPQQRKVFPDEPVNQLVDVMQDVVKRGTGTQARLVDRPVAGKTGTADAARDVWFVGFTPDLVTAVWGGNDADRPIPGYVTGGTVMAKIWQNYNRAYYVAHPTAAGAFSAPQRPILDIDGQTGPVRELENLFFGRPDDHCSGHLGSLLKDLVGGDHHNSGSTSKPGPIKRFMKSILNFF